MRSQVSRKQALSEAERLLLASGAPDARLDCEWMLATATGVPRLLLLIQQDALLSGVEAERFAIMLDRRLAGEPLQYILGEAHFMGHAFCVDERVLIPRCDTECLCEEALGRLKPGCFALDIGTGSGALAISMALACPEAHIVAVDISEDALRVAKKNAALLGARVRWVQSDLFAGLPEGERFDLIVSNPPYIPSGELGSLQREVKREPRLALDGGADGLSFYRRIAAALPGRLRRGGSLLLEVGDGQAADVAVCLKGFFHKIETMRDLAGLDRVVAGDDYAG